VKKFWKKSSQVPEVIENHNILIESHMTMPELEKILAFSLKRAKFCLAIDNDYGSCP
jgi:hypothetical protein